MTFEEFRLSLSSEEIDTIRTIVSCDKPTPEQARTLYDFVTLRCGEALGEDLVAEPFRYIVASKQGLRLSDLKNIIGEGFDTEQFLKWNSLLGFDIIAVNNSRLPFPVLTFTPFMAAALSVCQGEADAQYMSDIGYYLLERCPDNDPMRAASCFLMMGRSGDIVGMARFISATSNNLALQQIVAYIGGVFRMDIAPKERELMLGLLLVEDSQANLTKILTILINDVVGAIAQPERILPYVEEYNKNLQSRVGEHPELALFLPISLLRIAQAHRLLKHEDDARSFFDNALGSINRFLTATAPGELTIAQIERCWNGLKICQEMAQPKAMEMLFTVLSKTERAAMAQAEEPRKSQLDNIIRNQYIDMARTYWTMPTQLQEQFVDHSEETIVLLRAFLDDEEKRRSADEFYVANHYLTIADLSNRLGRENDAYEALTEAQIIQMRHLGDLQKKDGEHQMSSDQLVARLQLSVTNHMLADHYRRTGANARELQVLLQSNYDIAGDCFEHFPADTRVIHFIINAALELGDLHNRTHGYLTEGNTYQSVIDRLLPRLNNMRLDQQLAVDVAMIHSKAGQLQAGPLRQFSKAAANLTMAEKLWRSLAENTHNEQFRKNADAIQQTLRNISPKGGSGQKK